MQRSNIIVITKTDKLPQAWGNFKRACEENKLPYHSLKMKKFPIVYEDFVIHRCKFNSII